MGFSSFKFSWPSLSINQSFRKIIDQTIIIIIIIFNAKSYKAKKLLLVRQQVKLNQTNINEMLVLSEWGKLE